MIPIFKEGNTLLDIFSRITRSLILLSLFVFGFGIILDGRIHLEWLISAVLLTVVYGLIPLQGELVDDAR